MKPQLPQAFKICLSTLVVGGIYVLQNADTYAGKLKDEGTPYAIKAADWLTVVAEYAGLTEYNQAQRDWLDKWIALGSGEAPEEYADEVEPEIAEEPSPEPEQEPTPEPPPPTPQPPPPPAQPLPVADIMEESDDETDPLPAVGYNEAEPSTLPLFDDSPLTTDKAEPLPWPPPPTTAEHTPSAPGTEGDIEQPTPPPSPLVEDVSEPPPAPEQPSQPQLVVEDPPAPAEPAKEEVDTSVVKQAPPVRCKIMMMGDSLMEDLGPRTHRLMRHRKGLRFILSAKYSTGLCRPDFFDWPGHMRDAIEEHKPDILVVFIGANDGQPIKHNGSFTPTGGQVWRDTYAMKMQEIVDLAQNNGAKVIWVGLPAIGGRYSRLLAETSKAQEEYCTRTGIPFIDTKLTLSDENGDFLAFRKEKDGKIVRLRRADKTHLTPEGNRVVIDQLMPVLEKHLVEFSANHPEQCLTEEEVKKAGPAPLAVTVKYVPSTKKKRKKR